MGSAHVLVKAEPSSARSRWEPTLAAFAKADQDNRPAKGGVLFVGSSTIRMWTNLSQDFRDVPVVINRGFGGSTMSDCNTFVRELVTQYQPTQVMVYAGDNDLADGRSPEQVVQTFASFVAQVRQELPDSRIVYISIKPSPLRESLMDKARQTNALMQRYVAGLPNAGYVDIFHAMLGPDGRPKAELFLADRLHLNENGYRLWRGLIAGHLPQQAPATPKPQLAAISAP